MVNLYGLYHVPLKCPCHGSKFDMAGRVFQSVPAPLNLEVPPYTFLDETTILVGEEKGVA